MSVHTELRHFWHLFQGLRHRHAQAADDLGFGYSRSDSESAEPATVPDGIDLYFFTGRTGKEATR
jgi:hypothetical protein